MTLDRRAHLEATVTSPSANDLAPGRRAPGDRVYRQQPRWLLAVDGVCRLARSARHAPFRGRDELEQVDRLEDPIPTTDVRLASAPTSTSRATASLVASTQRSRCAAASSTLRTGSSPGTRVPVAVVEAYLERGLPDERILEAFPELTRDDVEAARRSRASAILSFLLDNDVDHAIASLLRSLGHDVVAALRGRSRRRRARGR